MSHPMSQARMWMLLTIVDYLHVQKREVSNTFKRLSSLVKHLDCGKHKRALEHETLYDKLRDQSGMWRQEMANGPGRE